MHMYNKSEELVKELEGAVQQEQNESRKSEYQRILQTQKNLSANLKSLGEPNSTNQTQQTQQTQQAYNNEFATEQNANTAQYTSDTQQQAKMEAEQEQKKKK